MPGAKRALYLLANGLGNNLLCVPAMKALAALSGEPIDIWDSGMHVKAAKELLTAQPWVNTVLDAQPDYRQYRYIVGSYWATPQIAALDGCTITAAEQAHRTRHEVECNVEAVRRAGFKGLTPSARLEVPEQVVLTPEMDAVQSSEYVAVCVESAIRKQQAKKCYPHWTDICSRLKAAGVRLVFLGNDGRGEPWMTGLGVNLVGKTTLLQAAQILRGARLSIGIDNALAHLAAAVGTPTLILFGPTSARKNAPWADNVHIIHSEFACSPCYETSRESRCSNEPDGLMPCMRAIPAESVAAKALSLLARPLADALPAYQLLMSRKQAVENCDASVSQKWLELAALMDLLRRHNPRTIVEIGTRLGGWPYCVAGVIAPGAHFICVDLRDASRRQKVAGLMQEQGFKVTFIQSDSRTALPAVQQALAGAPLDVLHIDGDHSEKGARSDYEIYSPLVRAGGLIVMHDVTNPEPWAAGLRAYWNELKAAPHFALEFSARGGGGIDPKQTGIGVLVKEPPVQPAK
jgi:predicted O-methyltransferase YrrM